MRRCSLQEWPPAVRCAALAACAAAMGKACTGGRAPDAAEAGELVHPPSDRAKLSLADGESCASAKPSCSLTRQRSFLSDSLPRE